MHTSKYKVKKLTTTQLQTCGDYVVKYHINPLDFLKKPHIVTF